MAGRKRGGQPGNKNAKGHKGANRFSSGAKPATARQTAARAASRANRQPISRLTRLKGRTKANLRRATKPKAIKGVLANNAGTIAIVGVYGAAAVLGAHARRTGRVHRAI